jgi:hypothetical protein
MQEHLGDAPYLPWELLQLVVTNRQRALLCTSFWWR